jgi:porphobilinogen synthase
MRIPEKYLAREIERIANAGIRSVMTFGISPYRRHRQRRVERRWPRRPHVPHLQRDRAGNGGNVRHLLLRIHVSYCGVLCDHGVDNDATLLNLGKQKRSSLPLQVRTIAPSAAMDGQVQAIRQALDAAGFTDTAIMSYHQIRLLLLRPVP